MPRGAHRCVAMRIVLHPTALPLRKAMDVPGEHIVDVLVGYQLQKTRLP